VKKKGWLLVLVPLLALTGCQGDLLPRARDITTVELMQVLALDAGAGERLRVTAATGVRSVGQGGEPKPPVVLHQEAATVLAACMRMQGSADGYASFSHVEQVVLSAEAAERSTAGLLDFLERDPEMRLDTRVSVTEGKAGELVEAFQKEERSTAELLEGAQRELEVNSQGWPVSVRELMADLEENGCALLPVVKVEQKEDKPELRCETMGWFQEDDFRSALTQRQARAAAILKGRHIAPGVRCIVIPATQAVYKECIRKGWMDTFIDAGCVVSTPTCGPCLGGHMGCMAAGERCVSTTNRNFVGRMGHVESEVYLASPAVAAASAITGKITHPKEVMA
jgi:hypothetical protein